MSSAWAGLIFCWAVAGRSDFRIGDFGFRIQAARRGRPFQFEVVDLDRVGVDVDGPGVDDLASLLLDRL
jgi:hypothetical protein